MIGRAIRNPLHLETMDERVLLSVTLIQPVEAANVSGLIGGTTSLDPSTPIGTIKQTLSTDLGTVASHAVTTSSTPMVTWNAKETPLSNGGIRVTFNFALTVNGAPVTNPANIYLSMDGGPLRQIGNQKSIDFSESGSPTFHVEFRALKIITHTYGNFTTYELTEQESGAVISKDFTYTIKLPPVSVTQPEIIWKSTETPLRKGGTRVTFDFAVMSNGLMMGNLGNTYLSVDDGALKLVGNQTTVDFLTPGTHTFRVEFRAFTITPFQVGVPTTFTTTESGSVLSKSFTYQVGSTSVVSLKLPPRSADPISPMEAATPIAPMEYAPTIFSAVYVG